MKNLKEEWNVPSVEALTQADGADEAAQVAFRNGAALSKSGPPT